MDAHTLNTIQAIAKAKKALMTEQERLAHEEYDAYTYKYAKNGFVKSVKYRIAQMIILEELGLADMSDALI